MKKLYIKKAQKRGYTYKYSNMVIPASKIFTCPLYSVSVKRDKMLTNYIYQQGLKTPLGTLQMQGVEKTPKKSEKPQDLEQGKRVFKIGGLRHTNPTRQ